MAKLLSSTKKKGNKINGLNIGVYDIDTNEEMSISKLAEKYKNNLVSVNKLQDAKTKREHLEALLDITKSAIPLAEVQFKERGGERNTYALTNLIEMVKGIVEELSEISDSENTYEDIILSQIAFQTAILKTINSEIGDYQKSIQPFFKKEKTQKSKKMLNKSLRKIGESMKIEFDSFQTKLKDLLEVY